MENKGMDKYELVIQSVKAAFFDTICREQGLLTIASKGMEGLTDEESQRLSALLEQQNENLANSLQLLDNLNASIRNIATIGDEIRTLTDKVNGNIATVTDGAQAMQSGVVESPVLEPVQGEGVSPVVSGDVQADLVIPAEQQIVDNSNGLGELVAQPSIVEMPVNEVSQGEVVPVVNETVQSSSINPVVEGVIVSPPVEEASVVSPVDTSDVKGEFEDINSALKIAPQQEVTPAINEVVQVPGTTGSIDEAEENTAQEAEVVPFVLSPIDDGVLPAPPPPVEENKEVTPEQGIVFADQQLQAIDAVGNDIINDTSLAPVLKEDRLRRFIRITQDVRKAILVTKAQYRKLADSKREQEKLLLTNQSNSTVVGAVPVVTESSQEEQVPLNSGLLDPSVSDKQKEMETLMIQANDLYKKGRAAEAQVIYDRITAMNRELQAGNSEGTALVKK